MELNLIPNLQCKFMLENINLNKFYYLFTVVIGKARQINEQIYYAVPDQIYVGTVQYFSLTTVMLWTQ